MTSSPIPVVFQPLFKSRPWGGRRLASLFGKPLPEGEKIGESWELCDLPQAEARVARGPCQGKTLRELSAAWGTGLTGGATLIDGRFPLLVKFLDAAEDLSIQLHPRPSGRSATDAGRVKHEAWVVLEASPTARIFAGCREGVTQEALAKAAGTAQLVELLRSWRTRVGDCFYLPSGTPHCLGAGIVVAEIQSPSDVTFRLFDWNRLDSAGLPRALHVAEALENLRLDVAAHEIVQPRRHVASGLATVTQLCQSSCFSIDRVQMSEGFRRSIATFEPVIWVMLSGATVLRSAGHEVEVRAGDVAFIPAHNGAVNAEVTQDAILLEVIIPVSHSTII